MPPVVRAFLDRSMDAARLADITPLVAGMRMIKGPEEIQLARHGGHVAEAMMEAGRQAIGDGVPEFEVVRAYGGRTVLVGDPKDHSTTDILAAVRALPEG